ncbi:MAG: PAS domain-containing protein [bacterium]|nr:PAS domain-containing protein [bacterium]
MKWFFIYLTFLLTLAPGVTFSEDETVAKRVLIINAYHEDYHWTDRIMDGIWSVFDGQKDIEIFSEYMDTKRCSDDKYFSQLRDLYAHKYHSLKFDAIVSSDDHALNFLLKYRQEIFPDVPVFFCGINDFQPDRMNGHEFYTGVYESYDVAGTIDLMLMLHPGTKKIVTITDATFSGNAFKHRIERAEPKFIDKVNIEYLDNLSHDDLKNKLGQLSNNALVLWAVYLRSPDGMPLSCEESVRMTTMATDRPVYCIWDVVGQGVVGGKITSPNYQGKEAAKMALGFLRGEPFDSFQISGSPMVYLFDFKVLKSFGIGEGELPPESIIFNRPFSVYREYRKVIWITICSVIMLVGVILALFHYIKKHSQARAALIRSEERLKLALVGSNDGLWDWDYSSNIVYFNDRYYTMAGYEPQGFPGKYDEWTKRVHPDDLAGAKEAILACQNGIKNKYDTEFRFLRKDKTWMWIRSRGKVVNGESGSSSRRMVGTHTDITDRKLAESRLHDSMQRFETISGSVADTILLSDADGNISYINHIVEGLTEDKIFSTKAYDFVPEAQRSTVIEALATVFELGKSTSYESSGPGPNGTERNYFVRVSPVWSGDEVASAVFLASDITDRKRAEEERTKHQRLEGIGTLAGGIAHDFNNLLMSLFGNISIATSKLDANHPAFPALTSAEEAMDKAIGLTNQLLTFAKGGEPVREVLDFARLVHESVRFNLSGANVKPEIKSADDLMWVNVDRGQMHQVISNLAINAIQAMPQGGILYFTMQNIKLKDREVENLENGFYIRVTVRDEGVGISQEIIDSVFDPYFTTKVTGSGLGLATIYSIVKRHGGHISVESEPGMGSTFILHLPASEKPILAEDIVQEKVSRSADIGTRILVMDDDEMIQDLIRRMLEPKGYSVESASAGEEAVDKFKRAASEEKPFDAVIMDLTIPGGMGGRETVKKILEIDGQAKCIVSSGYATDPICANFKEYGFKGVVEKPYTSRQLSAVLNQVINN